MMIADIIMILKPSADIVLPLPWETAFCRGVVEGVRGAAATNLPARQNIIVQTLEMLIPLVLCMDLNLERRCVLQAGPIS